MGESGEDSPPPLDSGYTIEEGPILTSAKLRVADSKTDAGQRST
jgi:hypothetical protein